MDPSATVREILCSALVAYDVVIPPLADAAETRNGMLSKFAAHSLPTPTGPARVRVLRSQHQFTSVAALIEDDDR